MRSEQMERIRRRLELEKTIATAGGSTHPLDAAIPWDLCFKEAASDTRYWDEELHAKAVLYITHIKLKLQLTDPGHGMGESSVRAGAAGRSQSHQGEGPANKRKKTSNSGRGGGRGAGHKSDSHSRSASMAPSGSSKGHGKSKGKAKQADGRFRVDTAGNEICWNWNKGESGCSEICAAGRAHVCEWCRSSNHRSFQCLQKAPGWKPGAS